MNTPAIQIYIGDLLRETSFTGLSLAAQGLWIRMLMVMHDSPKRGYLVTANGMQMVDANGMQTACKTILHDANAMQNYAKLLAAVVGRPAVEIEPLLQEMKTLGTFSTDSDGTIYCRRMAKSLSVSEKRRQAANKRWNDRCKRHANDANDAPSSSIFNLHSAKSPCVEDLPETENLSRGEEALPPPPLGGEVRAKPHPVAIVPEHWNALAAVADAAGLRWSKAIEPKLREIWNRLPVEERLIAVEGIALRVDCSEYADPAFVPKLRRYLEEKLWTERTRPKPQARAPTKDDEYHRIFREMMEANFEREETPHADRKVLGKGA